MKIIKYVNWYYNRVNIGENLKMNYQEGLKGPLKVDFIANLKILSEMHDKIETSSVCF